MTTKDKTFENYKISHTIPFKEFLELSENLEFNEVLTVSRNWNRSILRLNGYMVIIDSCIPSNIFQAPFDTAYVNVILSDTNASNLRNMFGGEITEHYYCDPVAYFLKFNEGKDLPDPFSQCIKMIYELSKNPKLLEWNE